MTAYEQRLAELKEAVGLRVDDLPGPIDYGDNIIDICTTRPAIIDLIVDLMTDGDNYAFFNRCPACSCGNSGDANRLDCACWCHHPEHGIEAYIETVAELRSALADLVATMDLVHHGLTGLPELSHSMARANETLERIPPPRE